MSLLMRNPGRCTLLCLALALAACGAEVPASPERESNAPTPEIEAMEAGQTDTPVGTQMGEVTEAPLEGGEGAVGDAFQLRSPEFSTGDPIPVGFTCDGEDISPPLEWSSPPEATEALALILDDPDAPGGTWVHWLLFNIPPDRTSLPVGIPAQPVREDGSRHGANSWGRTDYGGPCPPSGTHRYFFKLYALDQELDLEAGATKSELLEAMDGHILAQAETIGTYSR